MKKVKNIEGKFKRTFLHYSDRDIHATTDLIDDETATTASDVHPQLLQTIYPRADDDGAQALAQHYQELARRERTVIDVKHAAELLLSSETDSKPITPGTWVRIQHTPHEDELAPFIEIPWIPSEARKEIISRAYIATLAVDDRVRVVSGQLVGLEGSIQSIQDSIAEIAVDIRPIGAATVKLAALWRLHMLGDKVEVVRGAHRGSRGFILSIQMNELNLCLHGSNQQITVECFNVIMDYKPTARNPIPISYNQTSQVVINPMEIESHESQSIRVSRQERNPYIAQQVIVISGAWKGHRGLLKFVYNQHHQVQLEAPQGRVELYVAKELALYRDSGRIIPLVNDQNGTVEPDWPLEPEMETPALDDGSSTPLPIPEPSDDTHYEPAWDPASTEADVEFAALQRRLTADLAALQPPVTTDDVPHEPIHVTTELGAILLNPALREVFPILREIPLRMTRQEYRNVYQSVYLHMNDLVVDENAQELRVSVYFSGSRRDITVLSKDVEPVRLHVGDTAMVTAGQNTGFVGWVKDANDDLYFLQPRQSTRPKKRSRAKSAQKSAPLVAEPVGNIIMVLVKKEFQ
ncbi:uncharacterized protein LAESUDRAFT_755189 [Laetiporus sulphureus 93-53]|uniref:KOW domain-containing protein n=1 Tax=Laetiporus sulphureus 93-53 TaxID=1314785 RepID=A0A165HCL0_9APHY|nr:uncharacterized protein LAESUDRAFT_755189 [Laetiporus sulphureus 93-53]KZT11550.1 hypothetical protein LAESUDRAFT_755189 [Laetiporus sulphureus 93-53]